MAVVVLGAGTLIGAFALRSPGTDAVLSSVPVGRGTNQTPQWALDPRTGHALVVDAAPSQLGRLFTRGGPSIWIRRALPHAAPAPPGRLVDRRATAPLGSVALGSSVDLLTVDGRSGHFLSFDTTTDTLYLVDTRNGTRRSACFNGPTFQPNVVVAAVDERAGHLFITTMMTTGNTTQDLAVGMFSTTTGSLERLTTLPQGPPVLAPFLGLGNGHTVPLPWVLVGDSSRARAFVFSTDKMMSALDTRSGRLLFSHRLSFAIRAAAIDPRSGHIVALVASARSDQGDFTTPGDFNTPTSGGTVLILDPVRGAIIRTLHLGSAPNALAVDGAAGRALIADDTDGTVSTIDVASGQLVRTIAVGRGIRALAVDERRGRAFVLTASTTGGRVYELNATSGAVLHSTTLPQPPIDMALDVQTGQLLILTSAPAEGGPDAWHWLPGWLRSQLPWMSPPPTPETSDNATYAYRLLTLDPAR